MLTIQIADKALERLETDIEVMRLRLRAEYMGLTTSRNAPDAERAATVDWIRRGSPVGDEDLYLAWLDERMEA